METQKKLRKTSVDLLYNKKQVVAVKSNDDKNRKRFLSYIYSLWIFIPAMIYFARINFYAVNIPLLDDYDAILNFLSEFKQTPSAIEKLMLMFSQHGDHRIFHSRVIYVLYYYVFGKINFRVLIFIANLQLVIIFGVLVYFIKKAIPKYWNFASLIIGFCLFDLGGYENADFAMCGLQNYGVIMLFMVSMFFYDKQGLKFIIPAAIFEAICVCSSGNGPICALMLVLFVFLRKEKRKVIVSGIVFVLCTSLYYINYERAVPRDYQPEEITPLSMIRFFFQLIGQHFSFQYGILFGVVILVFLMAFFPFSKKRAEFYVRESAVPFICLLGVVMATIISISIFRVRNELSTAYGSRYFILSQIVVAVTFLFIWLKTEKMKIHWIIVPVVSLVLLYGFGANYVYGDSCMEMVNRRLQSRQYYYGDVRKHDDAATARAIASEACRLEIYCIDDER